MSLFKIASIATIVCSATLATAALAQNSRMAPSRSAPAARGFGGVESPSWMIPQGSRAGEWRRGRDRRDDRRGRDRWNGWRGNFYDQGIGFYVDVNGLSSDEPRRDLFGFYGAGGTVRRVNGKALYDYDRSYPYDWYQGAPVGNLATASAAPPSPPRCEVQMVPDDRGGRTSVRVCRQ